MIQNVFVIILDTSTVLGINMECLEQELGIYNITCEEIGANRTGCRYKLSGRNTAIVQGNVMGNDHDLKYIASIEDYNHITVYDSSNKDVISKPFNYTSDVKSCTSQEMGEKLLSQKFPLLCILRKNFKNISKCTI